MNRCQLQYLHPSCWSGSTVHKGDGRHQPRASLSVQGRRSPHDARTSRPPAGRGRVEVAVYVQVRTASPDPGTDEVP